MSDTWYFSMNRKTFGPYTANQMSDIVRTGRLIGSSLVKNNLESSWVSLENSELVDILEGHVNPVKVRPPEESEILLPEPTQLFEYNEEFEYNKCKWYYKDGEESLGAFTSQEMMEFYYDDIITSRTQVWHSGLQDWCDFYKTKLAEEIKVEILPPIIEKPKKPELRLRTRLLVGLSPLILFIIATPETLLKILLPIVGVLSIVEFMLSLKANRYIRTKSILDLLLPITVLQVVGLILFNFFGEI